jgi:hypothetical protein
METDVLQPEQKTVLARYVTEQYVIALLGRSEASVYQYRRFRGLPFVEIPGDVRKTIRYDVKAVITWARKNGFHLNVSAARAIRLRLQEKA